MKRISGLLISAVTAAFLVGCGGGGGSSSGTSSTGTDITVERGPVYNATVTDANGQVATQKSGTNVYTFATTPVYPITATGGIIDVDGNGIDEGDVELTTVLTSYSTVITPITTYLGDVTTDGGKAKLAKLKEISGVADDNDLLKKVPSALSSDVIVLTNALFDIMNDDDTTNDDFVSDYDNSEFKTKITEYKTEADKYSDKSELLKALEEKAVTNLGLTKITSDEATSTLNGTTTSTMLKVADLTRFVSYTKGEDWYDDNTVADGKINFKSYSSNWDSATHEDVWTENNETNPYVTITKDSNNPYKLSFVDPDSKEEGTFTIISTKKVDGYSDLYVTKAEIKVTKKGTELDWDKWDGENPTYGNTAITDINGLKNAFVSGYTYSRVSDITVYFNEDNTLVKANNEYGYYTRGTTKVGTWKQEGDYLVATVGKETRYYKVGSENDTYYIADATLDEVGTVNYDTMYTGSSLEDLITDIKAPAPVFSYNYFGSAAENQTTTTYKAVATPGNSNLKVTYSISADYGDGDKFNIDSSTGVLTFKTAPDYEAMINDKQYHLKVKATDSLGRTAYPQIVHITVINVDETTPTTSTTSIVSGKQIVLNDSEGDFTLNFNVNGTYSEVEVGCSGLWKDLGNNIIAVTCNTPALTREPTESDTTYQFTTLADGTTVIRIGDENRTPVYNTIVSSSNL